MRGKAQCERRFSNCAENFLIITNADYYIQFVYHPDVRSLYCEAVSNAFLPNRVKLTEEAEGMLLNIGFTKPIGPASNYTRVFALSGKGTEFEEVSRVAIKVFSDVYCVSQSAELDFGLS